MRTIRSAAAVALVVIAVLGGGLLALATYSAERELRVGRIELSVQPFHHGALDVYVPLVDWGARFGAVRLPARLSIDVRTVNREAAERLAAGQLPDVEAVRTEARDAVASYLKVLMVVVFAFGLSAGLIVALAVRGRGVPRVRWLFATALGTALAGCLAIALLLPPRGAISDPEYYANGPDIPVALRAVEQAQGSARVISQELNQQLVGLARLVAASSERGSGADLHHLVLASDLHNNLLALPALDRAVGQRPLFFAGDLTSSGSPFEFTLVQRIVGIGHPFVFVSGNHDSDTLVDSVARAGGIVLTQHGRLRSDGTYGPVVVKVRGLRVAGYADPFERRARDHFRQLREPQPTPDEQEEFRDWLRPLLGHVDVVVVHSPALAETAADELRRIPPRRPLALLTGHTHIQKFRSSTNLLELNGGTVGGGGTGNLEKNQPFGLAVLIYGRENGFEPVAADLVAIDAHGGSARAERLRVEP
ncbi:MAG TPA: metallophosphoesterase [Thermoleophilaceae bacterium]|nr:metallophosphoesterase [Thermoleophilaceae bacterium]